MAPDLEALILSGGIFDSSPSPDAGWHEDERGPTSDDDGGSTDSDSEIGGGKALGCDTHDPRASIGMGPGRTGVKGVIRDRNEATSIERARRAKAIEQLNRRMERASLGGRTFLEEEQEREWEKTMIGGGDESDLEKEQRRLEQTMDTNKKMFGKRRESRFGHLREVGIDGFVPAIEGDRKIWVVVHLYEPTLDRCSSLDDTLAHLARLHPETKFLRSRASSLGFASSGGQRTPVRHIPGHYQDEDEDDDHDPYADEDVDGRRKTDANVDLDMLPTLLVYRDGNLIHNWVRVDWEAGRAGVEELLTRYHILPEPVFGREGSSDLDDDLEEEEEELPWSD